MGWHLLFSVHLFNLKLEIALTYTWKSNCTYLSSYVQYSFPDTHFTLQVPRCK